MQIVGNLGMMYEPFTSCWYYLTYPDSLGPVAQYHENSRFYSAVKPQAIKEVDQALPHITIEMPVYKEDLEKTMYVPICGL